MWQVEKVIFILMLTSIIIHMQIDILVKCYVIGENRWLLLKLREIRLLDLVVKDGLFTQGKVLLLSILCINIWVNVFLL